MNAQVVAKLTPREVRDLCRQGLFDRPTSGAAMGYAQVNLVILPAEAAGEFEEFCRLNPRPCPLLEVTDAGTYVPTRMAPDADVRTDLPRYRVYRHGVCAARVTDVLAFCKENPPESPLGKGGRGVGGSPLNVAPFPLGKGERGMRAFLIGCSFTFETALLSAGIPVRHIEEGRNVPMFRTNVACKAAGRFSGPLVVSMRPMTPEQADRAAAITAGFPAVHGAPVHIGDPAQLGIVDLHRPDHGDAVTIHAGEVPVFWACGVTPMEAILRADLELAITHEPGHMLVTDLRDEDIRSWKSSVSNSSQAMI